MRENNEWFMEQFRKSVMIVIKNSKKQILLVHKTDLSAEDWLFPGGGIEGDETTIDATKREAYEELGLNVDDFLSITDTKLNHQYRWNETLVKKTGYVGQIQNIIIAEVNDDVKLDLTITNELDDYIWVTIDEAKKMIIHPDLVDGITKMHEQGLI